MPNSPPPCATEFGRLLRSHRERVGYTLMELAELVGVTHQALSKVEGVGADPRWETAVRLADALGVPLGVLRGEKESPATSLPGRTVGEKVRHARKEKGLTQTTLGRRCRVNRVTLCAIERGRYTDAGFALVCRIADALGVGVDALRDAHVTG